MNAYPCDKSKDGMCEHGGNKNYNYGFMRGCAQYCRLKKKWVSDLEQCPKEDKPNVKHDRPEMALEKNDD